MAHSLNFLPLFFTLLLSTAAVFSSEELDDGDSQRREADRVVNLPDQPPVEFRHYAGYIKLRQSEEKALFYWFFEAQNDVALKPLVLWLNGGPGCSSIAYGAAQELGPFLVQSNGKLKLNPFSWNKAANMLFLESPVGVGFSYTNKSSDLQKLGDKVTAEDSHAFLIGWFKRFPNFKLHDFYIAGESYAGHYAPQLAELIYERNKNSSKDLIVNLKGLLIGNAAINDETDTMGMVEFAWSHAIISDQLHANIFKDCNFSVDIENLTLSCLNYYRDFLVSYSKIDIYNIYAPTCLSSSSSSFDSMVRLLDTIPGIFSKYKLWSKLPRGYDPCSANYAEKYLSREDVQRALHANVTKLSYPYTPCSNVIQDWIDAPDSVLPIIHKLLQAQYRVWIYSGDTDGRIPITSTRYSIKKMGLKVEEEWRAWFERHQVAGWVETYQEGLTLATIRGAGHQAPIFAPQQSLALFVYFLADHRLPITPKI
ncbi:serine carboxypeptidase-like 35 [Benincasa hispida]|uniref:serine carboxypeptidase-like 35 n=1 Tax=Benincasa hispida TaxID=102211 RepID=UPI00190187E3|nr:serine carboxypeptidase-like 35 [Benincasa hispida]